MTIYIFSVNIKLWNTVLEKAYVKHADWSGTDKGKQFKTDKGVSVTIWEKPKSKHGKKEVYINFYETENPKLYMEVKAMSVAIEDELQLSRKRKRVIRAIANTQCNECPKEVFSLRTLKKHVSEAHTLLILPIEKRKKMKLSVVIYMTNEDVYLPTPTLPYLADISNEDSNTNNAKHDTD